MQLVYRGEISLYLVHRSLSFGSFLLGILLPFIGRLLRKFHGSNWYIHAARSSSSIAYNIRRFQGANRRNNRLVKTNLLNWTNNERIEIEPLIVTSTILFLRFEFQIEKKENILRFQVYMMLRRASDFSSK